MKSKFTLLFILFAVVGFAQTADLQPKLDSILQEADLLYRYERAAWLASDLLNEEKKLAKKFGGYVVYHAGDTTTVAMLDKKQKQAIARYAFLANEFDEPVKSSTTSTDLSALERELFDTKGKVIDQLMDTKYEVTLPEGFDPNLVLIKTENGYKLYIIMGTRESGVIPFGNDYLFQTDAAGEITAWQKFHSRMIAAHLNIPGAGTVESIQHSHLRTTPYITATDICTFRLYAPFTELTEFSIYSPALGLTLKYLLKENRVEIED